MSGSVVHAGNWIKRTAVQATIDAGFEIENILVSGRRNADPDLILSLLNAQKGDPVLLVDVNDVRAQLQKISWVREARVERRLPDTIYIELDERVPLAIWNRGEDTSPALVDAEGKILTTRNLDRFGALPMISGQGAPEHAAGLLGLVAAEEVIAIRMRHAARIGDRRWDVLLDGGLRVRLPEDDVGLALRRLAALHEKDGLLDKDLREIDLRTPDRIIVKTRPGAVENYHAASGEKI